MLPGELCRRVIPTESAANTLHFVCRDGLTIAGSTQHDAKLRFAPDDRLCGGYDPEGIIGGLFAVSAKVDHFVAFILKVSNDALLVIEAGVIGTDGDFHMGWGTLENGAWG